MTEENLNLTENNIDSKIDAENLLSDNQTVSEIETVGEINQDEPSNQIEKTDTASSEKSQEDSQVIIESVQINNPIDVVPVDSELNEDSIQEIEEIDQEFQNEHHDYSAFSVKDFLSLSEKMLTALQKSTVNITDVRNIDAALKEIRVQYDELKSEEKNEARKKYIADNGNIEGFEYKNDNYSIRFESVLIQIRELKNKFFQNLEQKKESYFETKTNLLQKLREIVEFEEKGGSKDNWENFKKIQLDWKNAGNVNSPHNGSLWSAYNALVDRYFDIRSIQNELKDLDRKRNIEHKKEIVEKIEAISLKLQNEELSNLTLKRANDLLNEYKLIGPGVREEQDILWNRLKLAFDVIYEKKRQLSLESKSIQEEIYNAKVIIVENIKPYTSFTSDSINEWNAKTKELLAFQEQWNGIKGSMPREKAKDLSKEFWQLLKTFFKNKSEFFTKLESQRAKNLELKQALISEVEEILQTKETSIANTNRVIEIQKKWKTIGHVPEKFKDSIFNKFKKTCDSFFDAKRIENKEQDNEQVNNLEAKKALCIEIEQLVSQGNTDLTKLQDYKKKFAAIGFVPKKDMATIQNRFVKAINDFVKSSGTINSSEKDKMILQNEVDVVLKSGGNSKGLEKQENDLKRKAKALEDEISTLRNNIEFFGHSKNADKVKAEYNKKIENVEIELKEINDKIKLIIAAS